MGPWLFHLLQLRVWYDGLVTDAACHWSVLCTLIYSVPGSKYYFMPWAIMGGFTIVCKRESRRCIGGNSSVSWYWIIHLLHYCSDDLDCIPRCLNHLNLQTLNSLLSAMELLLVMWVYQKYFSKNCAVAVTFPRHSPLSRFLWILSQPVMQKINLAYQMKRSLNPQYSFHISIWQRHTAFGEDKLLQTQCGNQLDKHGDWK